MAPFNCSEKCTYNTVNIHTRSTCWSES